MGTIAVVTDSNSGITQNEAKELGIQVIPMPFYINGELYYEDITLSQEEFYERLAEDADISTSQPAPADVMELWEELLESYDPYPDVQRPEQFLRDSNGSCPGV